MPQKEHEDYYILPNGLLVFTAQYLKQRGCCCGNGCLNCPSAYENAPEPKRSILLKNRNHEGEESKRQS
ncbi:MAG: DUF5522 domain-containing protein [Chitinophagaceae bacterium]